MPITTNTLDSATATTSETANALGRDAPARLEVARAVGEDVVAGDGLRLEHPALGVDHPEVADRAAGLPASPGGRELGEARQALEPLGGLRRCDEQTVTAQAEVQRRGR